MKVYILVEFEDHEGSYITGVLATKEQAETRTKENIETLQKKPLYKNRKIQNLPHGYKIGSHGFIYEEHEVVYP